MRYERITNSRIESLVVNVLAQFRIVYLQFGGVKVSTKVDEI